MTADAPGEFLDHEWYSSFEPVPEPWREHRWAARSFLFTRSFLLDLAQPERLQQVRADTEHIAALRHDLSVNGLRRPLEVVIDRAGRVVLRDGHHRLVASAGLPGFTTFPVVFTESDHVRVTARPFIEVAFEAFANHRSVPTARGRGG